MREVSQVNREASQVNREASQVNRVDMDGVPKVASANSLCSDRIMWQSPNKQIEMCVRNGHEDGTKGEKTRY